jgi:hypothetical protein
MSEHDTTLLDFQARLFAGDLDLHLDALEQAVRQRRAAVKIAQAAAYGAHATPGRLCLGATVRFNDRTRPAYLRGVEARVVKVNPKAVKVVLDRDQGRFKAGYEIRVPKELVDVV